MSKNKKNVSNRNANTTQTGPYFVIANIEGDIRRKSKATPELCEKYGRSPEEIQELISRAYHGSENKVRELNRILENNDARYEQRMTARNRQNGGGANVANVAVKPVKTPQEIQQDVVDQAHTDLMSKTQALNEAVAGLRDANSRKDLAQANLAKAKKELTDADDAVMQAMSKKHEAENALSASRIIYETEVAKLKELEAPKLLHISAVKDGIPGGKVFMSAYDYAKLSKADKEKVIPVEPEDITFSYPEDFYMYPAKLGLDGYQSACQYALAYVQLILESENGVSIELICNDHMVKSLAEQQEP